MEYNRLIDHTLLKADATVEQIEKLCKEALQYNFFSVCVNSAFVPLAKSFFGRIRRESGNHHRFSLRSFCHCCKGF